MKEPVNYTHCSHLEPKVSYHCEIVSRIGVVTIARSNIFQNVCGEMTFIVICKQLFMLGEETPTGVSFIEHSVLSVPHGKVKVVSVRVEERMRDSEHGHKVTHIMEQDVGQKGPAN